MKRQDDRIRFDADFESGSMDRVLRLPGSSWSAKNASLSARTAQSMGMPPLRISGPAAGG